MIVVRVTDWMRSKVQYSSIWTPIDWPVDANGPLRILEYPLNDARPILSAGRWSEDDK